MTSTNTIIVPVNPTIMNNTQPVHILAYQWEVEDISFYMAKEKNFSSPVFSAVTDKGYKWRLEIDFSDETHCKDFLGLFLQVDCIGRSGMLFAKFKVAIIDEQQKETHTQLSQLCRFKIGSEKGWGFEKFIEKSKLYTSNSELLPNDRLTVYCAVIFSEESDFASDFDHISTQLQTPCNENTLSESFGSLLTRQNYFDVVLIVDERKFYVHKLILAARSPVFDAMFKYNMKENILKCIEISDMDKSVVEQMLHYIYTGKCKCDNLKNLAEGLFVAADKYDLRGLKIRCEKILLENLSEENATRILILAEKYGASKLKSITIRFMVANSNKIVNTASWDDMVVSHPQLFNEVFKALLSVSQQQVAT